MIDKTEGELLINYMTQHADAIITLVCSFNIAKPDDRVEYDIWLSSSNDRGLDFVSEFMPYDALLGEKVKMTPRYFTWACIDCDESILE